MLRMKKVLKGIIRGLDHIVNFIALSLILAAMFLSGYMLWDSHQVYQTADAKNYEAYIPTEKSTKSFEELQKINPDVIGWIRVNDTNINYPLVQTDNDDTYMNTDAEGNYSLSGAIFLHCANKPDFSDFDNIIYGHHMEKHMMFGDIGEFTKEQYFNEHPYGNLFFDGKDHGIEFYALMQVDAYNETIFNVCLDTPEAKQEYLQEIENNVLYKRDMNITEDDHLVLLTTCTSDMTNGSIQIIYKGRNSSDKEVTLSGAEFSIFPIQYMKNDELVWEDGFKDSGISLQDTSAEAREKQARQLFAFAKENNISGLMQETDTSGRTSFGELNEGIYLLAQIGNVESGTDKFESAPFLVNIPSEINGNVEYNVTIEPKAEWVSPETPPNNPDKPKDPTPSKPDKPNTIQKIINTVKTGDTTNIVAWFLIAIVSLGLIVGLYKKRKMK